MDKERIIAYFSMEIGLTPDIPTYSGGLGILAGDTIRSAADLSLPMVAVTLLFRKGYFFQELSPDGDQTEQPEPNAAQGNHERCGDEPKCYRRTNQHCADVSFGDVNKHYGGASASAPV